MSWRQMEGMERFRHGFPFATSRELQVQGGGNHFFSGRRRDDLSTKGAIITGE
jgi:hypothetical protein